MAATIRHWEMIADEYDPAAAEWLELAICADRAEAAIAATTGGSRAQWLALAIISATSIPVDHPAWHYARMIVRETAGYMLRPRDRTVRAKRQKAVTEAIRAADDVIDTLVRAGRIGGVRRAEPAGA